MKFERAWCMANPNTFAMLPIRNLLLRYIPQGEGSINPSQRVIDPFARNNKWGTVTNDLNPNTDAMQHLDAIQFLDEQLIKGTLYDVALLDPPYSPRQITECYASFGKKASKEDTQNARLYSACKDRLSKLLTPNGVAITFGWNSSGFGLKRGFVLEEILLVCHGGAHSDTIVTVERPESSVLSLME